MAFCFAIRIKTAYSSGTAQDFHLIPFSSLERVNHKFRAKLRLFLKKRNIVLDFYLFIIYKLVGRVALAGWYE